MLNSILKKYKTKILNNLVYYVLYIDYINITNRVSRYQNVSLKIAIAEILESNLQTSIFDALFMSHTFIVLSAAPNIILVR